MIIWLDNPFKYTYLRKTPWSNHFAKFNEKKFINNHGHAHTVIGYELLGRKEKGWFDFMVYWLKDYDYNINPDISAYKDGHMPHEGVKPHDLIDDPMNFKFREVVE